MRNRSLQDFGKKVWILATYLKEALKKNHYLDDQDQMKSLNRRHLNQVMTLQNNVPLRIELK